MKYVVIKLLNALLSIMAAIIKLIIVTSATAFVIIIGTMNAGVADAGKNIGTIIVKYAYVNKPSGIYESNTKGMLKSDLCELLCNLK